MSSLDWETLILYFPEWVVNRETGEKELNWWGNFSKEIEFGNSQINFLFKENYGVELKFNFAIPDWIFQTKEITEIYKNLTKEIYERVLGELTRSFGIFESWRNFVKKNIESRGNVGLQSTLGFTNNEKTISLWDYYSPSPTDKLVKIGKLPEESLNEKWHGYFRLSKNIVSGQGHTVNSITGKSISDCVQNANEIYQSADELKDLKI